MTNGLRLERDHVSIPGSGINAIGALSEPKLGLALDRHSAKIDGLATHTITGSIPCHGTRSSLVEDKLSKMTQSALGH